MLNKYIANEKEYGDAKVVMSEIVYKALEIADDWEKTLHPGEDYVFRTQAG